MHNFRNGFTIVIIPIPFAREPKYIISLSEYGGVVESVT